MAASSATARHYVMASTRCSSRSTAEASRRPPPMPRCSSIHRSLSMARARLPLPSTRWSRHRGRVKAALCCCCAAAALVALLGSMTGRALVRAAVASTTAWRNACWGRRFSPPPSSTTRRCVVRPRQRRWRRARRSRSTQRFAAVLCPMGWRQTADQRVWPGGRFLGRPPLSRREYRRRR